MANESIENDQDLSGFSRNYKLTSIGLYKGIIVLKRAAFCWKKSL
jgi:hypothetical protein